MLLILLAALIVLGALVWLTLALLRTWRLVKHVAHSVGEAGERIANASAGLQTANDRFDR